MSFKQKSVLLLFFFLFTGFALSAQDYQSILRKVDALASFPDTDFSARYTVVHSRPKRGRESTVSAIFRRDSREQYSIVIMEPTSRKGQAYLKKGPTLWFYDPQSRRFNSTSSQSRFQNSNARNSDFTRSTLADDYDVISGKEVKLGRFDCFLLELEANNQQVSYPSTRIWVDKDNLIRKSEDYSLSGQLMRTTAIPEYQFIGDKAVPRAILIVDALAGAEIDGRFVNEKTQISIEQVSLDNLPDSVFTKSFLETVSE